MACRHYLIEAINKQRDIHDIKGLLFSVSRNDVLQEDDKNFDVLHHAISANFIEVVHLVFLKGYFTEPHQPSHIPYLNLACKLGHTSIVSILLKERPHDIFYQVPATNSLFAISAGGGECFRDNDKESIFFPEKGVSSTMNHLKRSTPLNIAAEGGHLKCVLLVLNQFEVQQASSPTRQGKRDKPLSQLERAVEKGSTKAVQLLLEADEAKQQDVNSAFKMALHRKLSDCLDVLLKSGVVEVQSVLNDMNPYHVMYMYSSAYQMNGGRNYGLDKCTAILIKHGFCVNDFSKNGSFPLYSLINSLIEEKDFFPMETPIHHMSALQMLLKAEANPNFDEVAGLPSERANPYGPTVGRPLHTSALNTLFGALQNCDNWYAIFPEFITHTCGILLRGGCNPRQIDARGRTVLHDLMKCLAMEHTMGNMNVNILPVIQILLRYGADPNIFSSSEMYPASSYFHTLFNIMGGRLAFDKWLSSKCYQQVLQLLTYMRHSSRQETARQIKSACHTVERNIVPSISVVPHIAKSLQSFTQKQLSLQDMCRLLIWEAVGRQRDNLQLLPLPSTLRNSVLNFFC